jgi:high-affinity nickel-transport protein
MLGNHAAPLGIALLGLLLGMRHATDPDHVVAVTTILSRERRLLTAMRIGAIWGLGHTATVLAVGAGIIIFKLAIPARIGLGMEFAVALMLILLGISSVRILIRGVLVRCGILAPRSEPEPPVHSHSHSHGVLTHTHPHAGGAPQSPAGAHDHTLPTGLFGGFAGGRPLLRAFCIGLVHGMAGSAAIALLVLSAIPQPLWATLYLMVFCAGTILGMALITTAIAAPFMVASMRMTRVHRGLIIGSGLLSFGFGLFMALRIGLGGFAVQ